MYSCTPNRSIFRNYNWNFNYKTNIYKLAHAIDLIKIRIGLSIPQEVVNNRFGLRSASYAPDTVALPHFEPKGQASKVPIMTMLSIYSFCFFEKRH